MKAKVKYSGDIHADILEARGIDDLDYDFFDYDALVYVPDKGKDLVEFIEAHERVLFYTDVDVDGLSAAGVVRCYYPDSMIAYGDRGSNRGLTKDMVEELYSFCYPDAIVTLDCGITSIAGVERAKELNIDVFITDHHKPQEVMPSCEIINPHLDAGMFHELCGAGVIYATLSSVLGVNSDAIEYAGIGTICDVVPVTHDNRYLIRTALKTLSRWGHGNANIVSTAKGLGVNLSDEKTIAWYFGPAINAASRLGKTEIAFKAYVEGDYDSAVKLKELNKERKKVTHKVSQSAEIVADTDVVVGVISDPKTAIAGLTAGQMARKKQKPVCICVKGRGSHNCSIRTLGVIDAVEYLKVSEYANGGGHPAAAGFSVRSKEFDEFIIELSEYVRDNIQEIVVDIPDIEISMADCASLYSDIYELSPYGQGFSEPIFITNNINITANMLSYTANAHLRIELPEGYVYFYNPPNQEFVGLFDIAYTLSYNVWQKQIIFVVEGMWRK